jgi:predicted ester cyclase
MKVSLGALALLAMSGCASPHSSRLVAGAPAVGVTSDPEKVTLVRRFYEAMNNRSPDLLAEALAQDWDDIPRPPGQGPGLAGMQQAVAGFGSVFKDFAVTIDEVVVSGDRVVVRSTNRGVHVGPFAGIPATGRSFAMTSIDIHTVREGKIVQTRHVEDWLGVFVQLGVLPLTR